MSIYQIRNWESCFETAKSKTYSNCTHAYIPNKQTGIGFTWILSQPDGAAIIGIWCLIVEACSLQPKPRRGYLTDTGRPDGKPWTAAILALRWRRKPEEIQRALDVVSSEGVDWIGTNTPRQTETEDGRCIGTPAGESVEGPGLPAAAAPQEPPPAKGFNHFGAWIDLREARGLSTVAEGKEVAASKRLFAALGKDPAKLDSILRTYLADSDPRLEKAGWPISLVSERLQRYASETSPVERPRMQTPEEQWEQVAAHWIKVGHEQHPETWSEVELTGIRAAMKLLKGCA